VDLAPDALAAIAAGAPYGLVVLTSPRAVAALPGLAAWTVGAEIAAVGAGTASACAERGIEVKWRGSGGARTFLEALAARVDVGGMSVLHPRGDLSHTPGLPGLAGRGARVVDPVVYRTVAVEHPADVVRATLAGARAITFTSPSGVRSVAAAAGGAGVGAVLRDCFAGTLGPSTEDAARRAGFGWRGIPRAPEPAALADLVQAALGPR
jgi:uroporphyrinogen-III synthase